MENILWLLLFIMIFGSLYLSYFGLRPKEERIEGNGEIHFFLKKLISGASEKIVYVSIFDLCPKHPLFEIRNEFPWKIEIIKPSCLDRITSDINGNFIVTGNLLYVERDGRAVVIENPIKWMRKKYVSFLEEITGSF